MERGSVTHNIIIPLGPLKKKIRIESIFKAILDAKYLLYFYLVLNHLMFKCVAYSMSDKLTYLYVCTYIFLVWQAGMTCRYVCIYSLYDLSVLRYLDSDK